MALIRCSECRKKISEYTNECLNCGHIFSVGEINKIKNKNYKTTETIWPALIAIFIFLGIIYNIMP